MNRYIRLGCAAVVAAFLAACGSSSGPERGSLVEPAADGLLAVLTAAQIDAATSGNGMQALTGPARCDVEFVRLTYRTLGARGEDRLPTGEPIQVSGALLLPAGPCDADPAPLLAYARGTDVSRPRTMADPQGAETFLLAAMYAAQGYAVVATDYLGYAQSNYPFHPYLHADSEASAVIDSIRAARKAAEDLGAPLSGEVMLSGYSQGGHASMAAHRAIERDFAGWVLVEVAGVGYVVHVSPRTLGELEPSTEAFLYVHHHIREDAQYLFGFPTREERATFQTLIGTHGVGPTMAMAILATHPPTALVDIVSSGDIGALTLVPGVGRKTAERLLVELKSRLSVPTLDTGGHQPGTSAVADVREALAGLGYGDAEIRDTLRELPPGDDAAALLRDALKLLGARRA